MRAKAVSTAQVTSAAGPTQQAAAAWRTHMDRTPVVVDHDGELPSKSAKKNSDWVGELSSQCSDLVVGQHVLPYAASEQCCITLKATLVSPLFVSLRFGPLLLNDTISKEGSLKIIGDWYGDAPLEWVIANAPLQRMANESPIGLVGCRLKFWAHARVSRRWIGQTSPCSVPSQPQLLRIGEMTVELSVLRGIAAEDAMARGARVVNAQIGPTSSPAVDALGAEVLRLVSDRQWGIATAVLGELKLASHEEQCKAMTKVDHTKRTALRLCVDGQWEERPPVLQALENAIITTVIGARRPYFWVLRITAVCHRTRSFLGETRIGMPRTRGGFVPRPWSGYGSMSPSGDCQWSDPQACQGQVDLTWQSASHVGYVTMDETDLIMKLVRPGDVVNFGTTSFHNPLLLPMLCVQGKIVGIAASGTFDFPTCARVTAELQAKGPREVAVATVACGASSHALADDGLSPYTAALLSEDPCGLLADLNPALRMRIRKGDALAWAEVGRSSAGAGCVDLVATPLTRGLAVPNDLAEGLLAYCFSVNLPLLAVRVLSRIDGQQKLLMALERAEDPQWYRVAQKILQQSHSQTPQWCEAEILAYALDQIRKGRQQFRLLLHAFLGRIHSTEPDFYVWPAALSTGGAECSICFEPLCRNSPVSFTSEGRAVCPHFLCSNCARGYAASASNTGASMRCPECRRQGVKVSLVPQLSEDPLAWFDFLATQAGTVSRTMLFRAISAMLPVDADRLQEALSDIQISSEPLGQEVTAAEFLANGLYAWIRRHEAEYRCCNSRGPLPSISDRAEWFKYWDFSHTGLLHRGEILRAFLKTYGVSSLDRKRVDDLRTRIEQLWERFTAHSKRKYGHCSTDGVSCREFVDVGGFGDMLEEALNCESELTRDMSKESTDADLRTTPRSMPDASEVAPPSFYSEPSTRDRERRALAPEGSSARIAAARVAAATFTPTVRTLAGREAWTSSVDVSYPWRESTSDTDAQMLGSMLDAVAPDEAPSTPTDSGESDARDHMEHVTHEATDLCTGVDEEVEDHVGDEWLSGDPDLDETLPGTMERTPRTIRARAIHGHRDRFVNLTTI